jgi:hypothetical protein
MPEMRPHHSTLPERILALLAGFLVLKVTMSVLSNYYNYFPASFASGFLSGRESHFFGTYQWAFYTHILAGPVSLVVGLILIGERSRARFPKLHRWLGRIQVACVLLLVTPSGLWMARHAAAGPIAGVALAALAVATSACVALGARAAVTRRFMDHRRSHPWATLSSFPEIDRSARRTTAEMSAFRNFTDPSTKAAFVPPE